MTGSGTIGDPYIITTAADLQAMEDDLTAYYELGGNIDASATSGWNGGAGFLPIGITTNPFTGQLDGKGYTISGLFINRASDYQALIGLLGDIGAAATIQNVKMTGVNITGLSLSGALVGSMVDSTVTNCSSTGSVTSTTDYAGGLIGDITSGAVSKCWSSCTVVVGDDYAGGFVGQATGGTIDDCYARGDVTAGDDYAGGFCGYNQGATIDDCYSTGVATATGGFGEGGFVGDSVGTETNCFWDTETSGNATDGGSATGKTTAEMKTEATFTDAGWDFTTPIWYIHSTKNDGYPNLEARGISHFSVGNMSLSRRNLVVKTAQRAIDTGLSRRIITTKEAKT